ncbi:MAG: hypothetical protein M3137_11490 [Actinomycetota bacterium]|nr:hypothetical protein [Actinomycetota bacterium]
MRSMRCDNGVSAVGRRPFDPDVRRLGRDGSLAGLPADSPALVAVRELAAKLLGAQPPSG